jgi:AraC family transcriptional regulator
VKAPDEIRTRLAAFVARAPVPARRPPRPETPQARGGLAPHRLRRVLDYVEDRLGEDLPLRQLSALAGQSPSHFSRAFKQSMGVPPHRHLRERRLARARELLEGTQLPVLQVALEVGFASQSHFTTAFRRAVGCTPWRYRRRGRGLTGCLGAR